MKQKRKISTPKTFRIPVHFVDPYLKNPTNPITVNVIGAGGTGSHVLGTLGALHQALRAYDHPGLHVTVFDEKHVTNANIGRQAFFDSEIGLNKAVAIISRINRACGTNWKAIKKNWTPARMEEISGHLFANLIISCVDTATARFDIAKMLKTNRSSYHGPQNPLYWIDFGNSRFTGQVLLAPLIKIKQPASRKFLPRSFWDWPTSEFKEQWAAADDRNEPSCSLAQSLQQQGLYINRSLAQMGGMLIESLFREPYITYRGFFLNLADFTANPLRIE